MLLTLFTKFCFNCKSDLPSVSMKVYGTMVMVEQQCKTCGKGFKWHSQPLVLGKYPLGNLLLSFSVLMSGGSISKVLLIFKHMGLTIYSARTFFRHQTKFLFSSDFKTLDGFQGVFDQAIKENSQCFLVWRWEI